MTRPLFDSTPEPASAAAVWVNQQRLDGATLHWLQQRFGAVRAGRWWYDADSGAWGTDGGPTVGWLPASLPLPGPLPANASGGGNGALTGVFINGRELHPLDVAGLQRLLGQPVRRGQWWADARGRFGLLLWGVKLPALNHSLAGGGQGGNPAWSIASPDGQQFIGRDSDGISFATGSRGEAWFGE